MQSRISHYRLAQTVMASIDPMMLVIAKSQLNKMEYSSLALLRSSYSFKGRCPIIGYRHVQSIINGAKTVHIQAKHVQLCEIFHKR